MKEQRIELGYTPRPWQSEVHVALTNKRWGALVVHRRGGKTVLAIMHMLHKAIELARPNGRYAYIAPQLKQAKAIAWSYLKQYACRIPQTKVSESELHVTLPNGAQLRIHGADNADALRGAYFDGVVLDEVAQLSKELWDSVLRPALSDRTGWALMMGTPSGVNLLSETYFNARGRSDWYAGLYTIAQTGALPAVEVDALKAEMTTQAFAREFLCDFSAAADNVLLSMSDVEAAMARHYDESHFGHAPRIIGVDVARQGDDSSVLVKRQGVAVLGVQAWQKLDIMTLAGHVACEINEWKPDAVFIDGTGGYGAGLVDRLRQLRHRVVEVQFGGSPDDARYANKRAEMWFRMAEWIKQAGHLPRNHQLAQGLCAPTYGNDTKDRLLLESKDRIKSRGVPSPDEADALACTFAFSVATRSSESDFIQPERKRFDPLARVR